MGKVLFRRTNDRKSFVRDVIEEFSSAMEGWEEVVINLSLVSNEPYPATTHPDVLSEIISLFREKRVSIVAGPAVDSVIRDRIPESHPLRLVARKFGFDLTNLNLLDTIKVKGRRMKLRLANILGKENMISLPVLREHKSCKISCALENQLDFLSVKEKFLLYTRLKDIHLTIAEVNLLVRPKMFLVDAIEVMVGAQERRRGGRVEKLGYMIAGDDPVSIDSFCLELMGEISPRLSKLRPEDVKYLRLAEEAGIGSIRYKAVEI
ncbi:MAG: hypothetical protein DRO05_04070 [Thermoproteota archaeon]|nr:MAG: hypothetical protein DRO05_04070 [Candidatus Korarchaeota archaeon]